MADTEIKTPTRAQAYLNYAMQYHQAAEDLFVSNSQLNDVLYFLYFHTIELLLKALFRVHDREPWGHKITMLYTECVSLGLTIDPNDDRDGLQNIVRLLESGTKTWAFGITARN
jgi:HEPN domain-containing protein